MANTETITKPAVITNVETEVQIQPPKMYRVRFHNDEETPFDYVITVLRELYNKSQREANKITRMVHFEGSAIAGVYDFETAETKITETNAMSVDYGYELKVTMEPDEG